MKFMQITALALGAILFLAGCAAPKQAKADYRQVSMAEAMTMMEEETGYIATEWIDIGDYYPAAAYCDERITLYLARGLSMGQRHLDEDEFLNVSFVPMEELVEEILQSIERERSFL